MIAWPLDGKSYTAEAKGAYNATRTRGVYSSDICFRVQPAGGLKVTLSKGLAWLKPEEYWGMVCYQKESQIFDIPVGSGELDRYFGIAIQYNKSTNEVAAELKTGDYSTHPAKPTPRHDAYFEEIIPFTILQRAGAIEITPSDIHDERLNEEMCGLMRDGVTGIPTAALNEQAEALLQEIRAQLGQIIGGAIPDNSISNQKIQNGAITNEKLSSNLKLVLGPGQYGTGGPPSAAGVPDGTIYVQYK